MTKAISATGTAQTTKLARQPSLQERQQHRDGQRDGKDFADQQSVGEHRRPEADPVRQPRAHQRRHRGMHDRNAEAGHDRCGVEREDLGRAAAQRRAGRRHQQAGDKRRQRAETRDQQRAKHRRAGEQDRRQAGQDADLRLRHAEVGADQRNDRRHRQNRDARADAGKPEQEDEEEKLALGRGGFGGGTHGGTGLARPAHRRRTLPPEGLPCAARTQIGKTGRAVFCYRQATKRAGSNKNAGTQGEECHDGVTPEICAPCCCQRLPLLWLRPRSRNSPRSSGG